MINMEISINTKGHLLTTIGHTENFKPVLYFKIGQRKQAIADLTIYFNDFDKFLRTGVELTEQEYIKFEDQFLQRARKKAIEFINPVIDIGPSYKNRFFTFLPNKAA